MSPQSCFGIALYALHREVRSLRQILHQSDGEGPVSVLSCQYLLHQRTGNHLVCFSFSCRSLWLLKILVLRHENLYLVWKLLLRTVSRMHPLGPPLC